VQQQIVMSDLVMAHQSYLRGLLQGMTKLRTDWINAENRQSQSQVHGQNGAVSQQSRDCSSIKALLEQDHEQLNTFRKSVTLDTPGRRVRPFLKHLLERRTAR
jgi:hypothetical protein